MEVYFADIRPFSYKVQSEIKDNIISFKVPGPGKYTIEPNGNINHVLHLFVNPIEKEIPSANYPNVIYFGPGYHEIGSLDLKDNQTLYIAGGAVVHSVTEPDEKVYREEFRNGRGFAPHITFDRLDHAVKIHNRKNVKIIGRGILCFSKLDAYPDDDSRSSRRSPIHVERSENIEISGIILRDGPCWNVSLYRSENCMVDNIKIISSGYNSDGINAISSQNITIEDCFLRQNDDSIVMKAMDTGNKDLFLTEPPEELPGGEVDNIKVKNCVIWSDWGYALGATYEIRKPVKNVTFVDCDVINATYLTNTGVLGILVSDVSNVTDVKFNNIRIERSNKALISLETRKTPWSVSESLGEIRNINFNNISLSGRELRPIRIKTFEEGLIDGITFSDLQILNKNIKQQSDAEFIIQGNVSNIIIE